MRSEEEIKKQIEISKGLFFDDNTRIPAMYTKGRIYALKWVISEEFVGDV